MSRLLALPLSSRLQVTTLALAAVVVVALAFACGNGSDSGGGELFATGVIIDVQAPSATAVDSLTLRTNEGETLIFSVAPEAYEDPEEGLFPSHLRSHALLGEQVTIFYREDGGELVAVRLMDADR